MQLRTELEILAAPEKIWEILLDFGRYQEWNPFIVSLKGEAQMDQRLEVCVALPENGGTRTFRPIVTTCEAPLTLAWRGELGFAWLFAGHHVFELHPLSEGRTRFVHSENFTGLLTRFMGRTLTLTGRGFVYMNQALKKRAES